MKTTSQPPLSPSVESEASKPVNAARPYRIAIAGIGYVGLSLAVLLSQHNPVIAVDKLPSKVEMVNVLTSPIQDEYIEQFMLEARSGERLLDLHATTDGLTAYAAADFIIVAVPTN